MYLSSLLKSMVERAASLTLEECVSILIGLVVGACVVGGIVVFKTTMNLSSLLKSMVECVGILIGLIIGLWVCEIVGVSFIQWYNSFSIEPAYVALCMGVVAVFVSVVIVIVSIRKGELDILLEDFYLVPISFFAIIILELLCYYLFWLLLFVTCKVAEGFWSLVVWML